LGRWVPTCTEGKTPRANVSGMTLGRANMRETSERAIRLGRDRGRRVPAWGRLGLLLAPTAIVHEGLSCVRLTPSGKHKNRLAAEHFQKQLKLGRMSGTNIAVTRQSMDRLSIEQLPALSHPPPSRGARPPVFVLATMMASVGSFALGVLRLSLSAHWGVGLVLLVAGTAFAWVGLQARTKPAALGLRYALPTIGWAATFMMALLEGGLFSEALYWSVCVPLIAVLSVGIRQGAFFFALVATSAGAFGLLGYGNATSSQVLLRICGFVGAAGFATVVGTYYENERVRALAATERERARFQALADASPDLIFSYNVDTARFGDVGSFALRALGYRLDASGFDPLSAEAALGFAPSRLAPLLRRVFARPSHAQNRGGSLV
jgi:hypothetical protein